MLANTTETLIVTPDINSLSDAWNVLRTSLTDLAASFIANLPIYLIGLFVFLVGLVLVRLAMNTFARVLNRGSLEATIKKLAMTLMKMALMLGVTLLALSVAGVRVGAALAALGILGLAFAFAFQNILENFIAGLLLLIRKPLRIGDQVISGDFEGTVVDVNMRVTKLTGYDGVKHLLPNADVFRNPLTNLTEQGARRSAIAIGVDYRDDADAVPAVLEAAVRQVEGVLPHKPVDVLCTALGGSSVDFTVRYWTQPDIATVVATTDRVLRASKKAVEAAGMTIPWPIMTLEPGDPLRVRTAPDA